MKRIIYFIVLTFIAGNCPASNEECKGLPPLIYEFCQRLHQTWQMGQPDLYLTGYAWHNRFTYDKERVKKYNEQSWGGGLGKSYYDDHHNYHGIYAIAFLDSHSKWEPALGYAYQKVLELNEHSKFGLGYTILTTIRSDINHGWPFAGILPWVSLSCYQASIAATYIPGSRGAGNVLFVVAKYSFKG